MWKYQYKVPEKRKVRYIVHADCMNEADDHYTVVHALMMDRLDVRGIIGGHFDGANYDRFPEHTTAEASYKELKKIVKLMELEEQYKVYLGSNLPLPDASTPIISDGARFIIEEAMKEDSRPLYIGMQGALTDLASAILIEPRICQRMTCIWIGGGDYPNGGGEFNMCQDIIAANVVFSSEMPLWQIPRILYKQFATSLAELQVKVLPYGAIGKYLFEQTVEFNSKMLAFDSWPHGEIWTLGDEGCVCALLEEIERDDGYEMIEAPHISEKDCSYSFHTGYRRIRVYHKMDVRLDLEDLFARLKINYGN